jgi:hypothetical protein
VWIDIVHTKFELADLFFNENKLKQKLKPANSELAGSTLAFCYVYHLEQKLKPANSELADSTLAFCYVYDCKVKVRTSQL